MVINIGVIGVGNMGKNHARIYSELNNVKLVAVSDINENVGKGIAKKFKCKFYHDYKEMLAKEKIDAVSIAVPTSLHKEVTISAIDAGKNVLVEKPIADTIKNAKEIIKAAKRKNIKLMIGHIERFNPATQKLKEIIDNDKLGKIIFITVKRVGIFPPKIKDTNVIIDLAVHDIDICNYLLKKRPRSVYTMSGKSLNSGIEDYANIILRYDGVDAFIQVNWITPVKIRTLIFTGTKAHCKLDYLQQSLELTEGFTKGKSQSWKSFQNFLEKFKPKTRLIKERKVEPLYLELKSFINAIRKNQPVPVSGKEAMNVLNIALSAIKSYKEDKIIKLQ